MSELGIFVTVNVTSGIPIDLEVGDGSARLTFGGSENVALELLDLAVLTQLRDLADTGIARMLGQHSPDPETGDDSAGSPSSTA